MARDALEQSFDEIAPLPGYLSRNLRQLHELDRKAFGIGLQLDRRKKLYLKSLKESRKKRKSIHSSRKARVAAKLPAVELDPQYELDAILCLEKRQRRLFKEKVYVARQCSALIRKTSLNLMHVLHATKRGDRIVSEDRGVESQCGGAAAGTTTAGWIDTVGGHRQSGGAALDSDGGGGGVGSTGLLLAMNGGTDRKQGRGAAALEGNSDLCGATGSRGGGNGAGEASWGVSGQRGNSVRGTKSSTAVVGRARPTGLKRSSRVGCTTLKGVVDVGSRGTCEGDGSKSTISSSALRRPLRITLCAQRGNKSGATTSSCLDVGGGYREGEVVVAPTTSSWSEHQTGASAERTPKGRSSRGEIRKPPKESFSDVLASGVVGGAYPAVEAAGDGVLANVGWDARVAAGAVGAVPAVEAYFCPVCGEGEKDLMMVACDGCDTWYHCECVGFVETPGQETDWYCSWCKQSTDGDDG